MVQSRSYQQAELLMLQYLGINKMRNTYERRVILQHISSHKGNFTPADVIEWVKPHFISNATVYNTLGLLEKAHIVQCLHRQHSGRQMEYEFTIKDQSSIHIVCTRCGRVQQVKDKATDIALNVKLYPNFIMRQYSAYVFGECKRCLRLETIARLKAAHSAMENNMEQENK